MSSISPLSQQAPIEGDLTCFVVGMKPKLSTLATFNHCLQLSSNAFFPLPLMTRISASKRKAHSSLEAGNIAWQRLEETPKSGFVRFS